MKCNRIITLLLALTIVLSLCACGEKAKDSEPTAPVQTGTPDPAETPAQPVETEAPADGVDLRILYEQDDSMINTYSLLAIDPDAPFTDADGAPVSDVYINADGAAALINWMLSQETLQLATEYGYADYGEYLFYLLDGAPVSSEPVAAATEETKTIRLSTTTSVNDSGLLGYLLPVFEQTYGYSVEVYSAGTGKAIANAKYGNADLILVHAKSQEEAFVADGFSYVLPGFASERLSFLYNFFVLCGPSSDPAGAKDAASVKDAFAAIAAGKHPFVSRGDSSGTHTKEITLWPEDLGITTDAASVADYTDWYTFSNAGMGVCLTMAEETGAYILSDKATFLTFRANNG